VTFVSIELLISFTPCWDDNLLLFYSHTKLYIELLYVQWRIRHFSKNIQKLATNYFNIHIVALLTIRFPMQVVFLEHHCQKNAQNLYKKKSPMP